MRAPCRPGFPNSWKMVSNSGGWQMHISIQPAILILPANFPCSLEISSPTISCPKSTRHPPSPQARSTLRPSPPLPNCLGVARLIMFLSDLACPLPGETKCSWRNTFAPLATRRRGLGLLARSTMFSSRLPDPTWLCRSAPAPSLASSWPHG